MRQERTVATRRSIAIAASCIMTDARSRPDIVHSPDNRFAAFNNFANTFQWKHSLIDPGQMNDVSLLKLTQLGNIRACTSQIYFPKMDGREVKMPESTPAFPQKMPLQQRRMRQTGYRDILCCLITHQHLSLNTIIVKGFHQTVGCNCSTSRFLACIYYEYSHAYYLLLLRLLQRVLLQMQIKIMQR